MKKHENKKSPKPFVFNDGLEDEGDEKIDVSRFAPAVKDNASKIPAATIEKASEGSAFKRSISTIVNTSVVASPRRGGRPSGPPGGQVNIKGPIDICDRFKARAYAEDITNATLLERGLNAYEEGIEVSERFKARAVADNITNAELLERALNAYEEGRGE